MMRFVSEIKKSLVSRYVFYKLSRQWQKLSRQQLVADNSAERRLVVIPCDPETVGGSRGDEAMIMGVMQLFRKQYPNIPISVVCVDDFGEQYVKTALNAFGATAIKSWNGAYPLERIYTSVIACHPSDVVILGADCMDGFYSPTLSLMLLALHDLFSKTVGVSSRLLGFSFNTKPDKRIIRSFKSLTSDVVIRLRDAVSYQRYNTMVDKPAKLVADAAFLLQPDVSCSLFHRIDKWAKEQHEEGQTVIGLNFHPMLRHYAGLEDIESDALDVAKHVERILQQHPKVSFVFIPHDDRSRLTDNVMLSVMYDYLQACSEKNAGIPNRVSYFPEVPRASHLKAICGLLDGLVTSRMHLAIAALGMEVPVMAATYQGKFEGLFQHFGINGEFLLSPQEFLSDVVEDKFSYFLTQIPKLKAQISATLPKVLTLSYQNICNE